MDTFVDIRVVDDQGKNLLNAPAMFDKKNIEVYYVTNGTPISYNQPNLDASGGFTLYEDQKKETYIRVFLNHEKKDERTTTLIKFGSTSIDAIEAEFRTPGSSVMLEKVWFNKVLKEKTFTIVK